MRDKAAKTITVQMVRSFRHPKYGKMVRRNVRIHAHDADSAAHIGDTVEVVECRPLSRTKRWRLVRVIERETKLPVVTADGARPPETSAE